MDTLEELAYMAVRKRHPDVWKEANIYSQINSKLRGITYVKQWYRNRYRDSADYVLTDFMNATDANNYINYIIVCIKHKRHGLIQDPDFWMLIASQEALETAFIAACRYGYYLLAIKLMDFLDLHAIWFTEALPALCHSGHMWIFRKAMEYAEYDINDIMVTFAILERIQKENSGNDRFLNQLLPLFDRNHIIEYMYDATLFNPEFYQKLIDYVGKDNIEFHTIFNNAEIKTNADLRFFAKNLDFQVLGNDWTIFFWKKVVNLRNFMFINFCINKYLIVPVPLIKCLLASKATHVFIDDILELHNPMNIKNIFIQAGNYDCANKYLCQLVHMMHKKADIDSAMRNACNSLAIRNVVTLISWTDALVNNESVLLAAFRQENIVLIRILMDRYKVFPSEIKHVSALLPRKSPVVNEIIVNNILTPWAKRPSNPYSNI